MRKQVDKGQLRGQDGVFVLEFWKVLVHGRGIPVQLSLGDHLANGGCGERLGHGSNGLEGL